MTYVCEITTQPAQPTLSIRTRAAAQGLPAEMGRCFGAIAAYLGTLGQQPICPVYAAYFNMDMSDLDVEIGMGVASPLPGQGEIAASTLPAGDVASTVHEGPYEDIGPAYDTLNTWVRQQRRVPAGVAYEYYLNDPSQTSEPPRTRIVFPLRPKMG